jgi:hypothetical protein
MPRSALRNVSRRRGRGLGDLAGGLDLVVEDDEHAEPARL